MLLMAGVALAGEPLSLAASVQASVGAGELTGQGGLGHDVRLGVPVGLDRLLPELISASTNGNVFELRAGARMFLSPPWTEQGALSLTASAGLAATPLSPLLTVGAAADLPLTHRTLGRIGLEVIATNSAAGLSPVGLRASAGLVLPPRAPEPVIITQVVPEPAPAEEVEPFTELVWVPEPICDWLPVDDVDRILAALPTSPARPTQSPLPTESAALSAESPLPTESAALPAESAAPADAVPESAASLPEDAGVALAAAAVEQDLPIWSPERTTGTLIVLAHPGDRVRINGQEARVSATGVAQMSAEEGRVQIEVLSGGQRQTLQAALVTDSAVWVRVGDPDPTAVFFQLGSSTLTESNQQSIIDIARYAAQWSFVLQGGYSPEGTLEHNRQLAVDRARAVSAALQEAGIPPDRIVYLDPPPPDPNKPATSQRNCRIIPIAPGGEE